MAMDVLTIEPVRRLFGGIRALDDASLEARSGQILAIVGPNGISGRYHPDRGCILVENQDITHLPPHKIARLGIARTFQNVALFR